jgi:hypothetical protein
MHLHCSNYDGNNEMEWDWLGLEWIGEGKRFYIGFEGDEVFWHYVTKDHSDVDDMSSGDLDKEVLEYMYQRIGKILGKTI